MKKFFRILLIIVVLTAAGYWFLMLNRPGKVVELRAKEESEIRVGTININRFSYMASQDVSASFLLWMATSNDLDVLMVQDCASTYDLPTSKFIEMFAGDYPYAFVDGETAVFSRLPVVSHSRTRYLDDSGSFTSVVVSDAYDRKFTVISSYLKSTGLFYYKHEFAGTKVPFSEMSRVLKNNKAVRLSQAVSVRRAVDASEWPVIAAGDYNSLPLSKVYRMVRKFDMKDSFMQKGRGHGATYRALGNLMRIDYILFKGFECTECFVPENPVSDHKMVISTLKFD